MSLEVSGKIKVIMPEQQVSASFRKREIVVTTEEQYQQHILIGFTQDKCDLLDQYKKGDDVKISINLRGREWVNPEGASRYFNEIQGWRIEKLQTQQPEAVNKTYTAFENHNEDPDDGLPF